MEEKFYTIDQIAEMLELHHKTIRKFINEGKLRANKIGKQWRITGHDLSLFMENNNVNIKNVNKSDDENIKFSTSSIEHKNITSKIGISTVVDLNSIDLNEYRKLSNMLLAVMNSKDNNLSNSTINIKYYPEAQNLKIMLWGGIEFIKEMLDFISTLIESSNI